ncbi:MAG: indole-3-glycerol phosphate synthase TrpC [Methylacidiphilales bacterium]|nr:indole-3-glycerol phosphate synthase TrpC [Candidatus Methylacidiphilales bacterium]MDW8350113.1 indole-3-glycerol phosphate synthase TrpC [Verrucomicrobiae bacterium]
MNKLSEILRTKQQEVASLLPEFESLRRAAWLRNEFCSFENAIRRIDGTLAIIAEIKRQSPSAGVIAPDFDPVRQARLYQEAGADALSVLTDSPYFGGSIEHLQAIRKAVDLPILRKDFIIHEVQLYQSVVAGADAVLLIVAALDQQTLQHLHTLARDLQLDVLVEVHTHEEIDRALEIDARIIGINNRDLKTFTVDLSVTDKLIDDIPADVIAVSESGIKNRDDARFVRNCGAQAILVGETLMRAQDVADTIRQLSLRR